MKRFAVLGLALTLALPAAAQDRFACPQKGGNFVFALEARVPNLDQHAGNSAATRNVAMNIFETLLTRDEHFAPMLELADSMTESPDKLTYTFKIRQGIKFHNGKPLTSADVEASFNRYKRLGVDRQILQIPTGWEAPDPQTFVVHLKEPLPTFIEQLSTFTAPIVIIPAENENAPPTQLPAVGTGPYMLDEMKADSYIKLKRYDGYTPDTRYKDLEGFAGYKVPCLDTVTYRMMTEPAARTAALEVGEIQGVEDVPVASQKRLSEDKEIKLSSLGTFWLQVAIPNFLAPPTNNLQFRQAMLAAMDFEEIMEAASEGKYQLVTGFQYPGQPYYTDAGKELLNQHNPAKAKELLAQSGYKGEPVILLTNREFPIMYNTSLVMAEQLKAVGINAQLQVLDWPAALQKSVSEEQGWNVFYTG
ncbi:MAG: ABC transporter substrate-binding protein, partial [Acetobacteraceae bacterium]|nr:ABC transporter substrate-binding protein [Acetobacteraceae bacterium]